MTRVPPRAARRISGIKERLKLSPAQEQHWPGVESSAWLTKPTFGGADYL
jgi:hypothetical protein